jgi:hypothetical protein
VRALTWVALALAVAGCSDPGTDVPAAPDAGAPVDGGASDAGPTPDAGGEVDGGSADAGTASASCRGARGVCVGDATRCTAGGGRLLPAHDADCDIFSDGPGRCCVPPAPKPSGDSCEDLGGVCAPIGGCIDPAVNGFMTSGACSPIPYVCCVPEGSCPEPRPVCCDESATYRAMCVRGDYVCPSATLRMSATGSCE